VEGGHGGLDRRRSMFTFVLIEVEARSGQKPWLEGAHARRQRLPAGDAHQRKCTYRKQLDLVYGCVALVSLPDAPH
jgi:hypothetical protein